MPDTGPTRTKSAHVVGYELNSTTRARHGHGHGLFCGETPLCPCESVRVRVRVRVVEFSYNSIHYAKLYPQNGDRVAAIDSVTSFRRTCIIVNERLLESSTVQRRHAVEGAPRRHGRHQLERRRDVDSSGDLPLHLPHQHPLLPVRRPDLQDEVRLVDVRRLQTRHQLPQRHRRPGRDTVTLYLQYDAVERVHLRQLIVIRDSHRPICWSVFPP